MNEAEIEARLKLATLLAVIRTSQDLGAVKIQLQDDGGADRGTFEIREFADDLSVVLEREVELGRHLAANGLVRAQYRRS